MSTLRSILVHLDASPRSARRLALSCELAALHDARVTALYASTPAMFGVPFLMDQGGSELLVMLQQLDIDRRDDARALFDREVSTPAAPVQWRELHGESVIPGVAGHALCTDLLVLGQHDPSDPLSGANPSDFVPSVLLASGRPALVVPYVDAFTSLGRCALIAWKSTRESAHAVSAAMPLLRGAQRIHLVAADDDGPIVTPGGALEDYLRLHGVHAPVQRHEAVPAGTAGEGLLSLAADLGADLLVMGCYGHSRARELVLGGASRTVLASMTLPVLMAH